MGFLLDMQLQGWGTKRLYGRIVSQRLERTQVGSSDLPSKRRVGVNIKLWESRSQSYDTDGFPQPPITVLEVPADEETDAAAVGDFINKQNSRSSANDHVTGMYEWAKNQSAVVDRNYEDVFE